MTDLKITAMDHIVLNVADIDRSLGFYCGVLGLKSERLDQFQRGEIGFPSVRINANTVIDLVPAKDYRPQDRMERNLNHYCLVADNLDLGKLVQTLKSKNVTIVTEPVSRWGARGQATSIYILDPDENEVEIRCY